MRRVEILTEPGVPVPCEVHYYKDTEAPGEKRVLWSAQAQAGYCEDKVDGLLTKLEGLGWDCGRPVARRLGHSDLRDRRASALAGSRRSPYTAMRSR